MRRLLFRLFITVIMAIVLQGAMGQERSGGFRNGDYLYKPFPLEGLRTMQGDSIRSGHFAGKPLWVHFWFIQCQPCVEELPEINRLARQFADSVQFLAITFDKAEAVRRFLAAHPFPFLHATDARPYIDALRLTRYPRNILIDRHGIVQRITDGLRATAAAQNTPPPDGYGEVFAAYLEALIQIR